MTGGATGEVRLAELIASLSLATDLGMGQPVERAMRAALVALRLGEAAGCGRDELRDVYYLSLLQHIGCTAHAHEYAEYVGGDEIAFRTHAAVFPSSPMGEVMATFIRQVGRELPMRQRAALVAAMMRNGRARFTHTAATQCEAAICLAQRMSLAPGVVTALGQTLERWDGRGGPAGIRGDQLTRPMRIVHVAHDAEYFERLGGLDACREAIRKRRGHGYDPSITDAFLGASGDVVSAFPADSVWDAALAAEPEPQVRIPATLVDDLARAFADFTDLKSPFTTGHSTGVAALLDGAAREAGVSADDAVALRRGALLHDLGRVAVPNGIWDKAGPLTPPEWERVRLHPYYTDRILARSATLQPLAALSSSAHERANGSGYHRGNAAAQLSPAARLLAAADAYQAMTQERPHRPALAPEEAAAALRRDVDAGLLDRRAGECVLAAAGHARRNPRGELPAGLSAREVDVLRLICLGRSNRQMAASLFISEKTVGHHVAHIYDKIGRATRAGAALFAMEHGLAGPDA
jgi:HD-GYP domain-containing protein (c-di-GMP phosphodiesterase class II)